MREIVAQRSADEMRKFAKIRGKHDFVRRQRRSFGALLKFCWRMWRAIAQADRAVQKHKCIHDRS